VDDLQVFPTLLCKTPDIQEKSVRKILLALTLIVLCPFLLIAQDSLNNDAVIKMVKAGLSDDLVVSAIYSKPGTYKTSVDDMIALKSAGVSDKVVAAIVNKSSGGTAPAPVTVVAAAAPASTLPPGIDEVGVYYQDKNGAWVALIPEVVNFKTGGVLKSFATNGIVKGDINGHIPGPTGKTVLTLPVTLAVYVPEGTAVAEYQLLRLRPSGGNSREFRSVTGGVIHASGGAARDLVAFESTKLATRVYQITLKQDAGKGEYGLLPPGATSSTNMASGGKIYTISVPE
jgi:hypothetical protein